MNKEIKKRVIFVCKGNMHRSPIAERVFKKELKKNGENSIKVDSYGLHGFILPPPKGKSLKDYPSMYKLSKPHLNKEGINMEDHESKPLNKKILEEADSVITMHPDVTKLLLENYPQFKPKTFLITELCSKKVELKDVDKYEDKKTHEETVTNTVACVRESFNKVIKLCKNERN